jgi:hypothetical protein
VEHYAVIAVQHFCAMREVRGDAILSDSQHPTFTVDIVVDGLRIA